jgi:acyl-CoA reductase-like NAD-dependent aldehyde dehydrogenase
MSAQQEINEIIAMVDSALSLLSKEWQAAPPDKKGAIMDRINAALDKRLNLMAKREEALRQPQSDAHH